MDHQRRRIGPARAGWHVLFHGRPNQEMPRRVQGERGARQPVCLAAIGATGEPAGEDTKIRRPVAAALVQGRDGGDQLWDGRPGSGAQQVGLRRLVSGAEEPAAQAGPALPPHGQTLLVGIGLVLQIVRRGIARLTHRHGVQKILDPRPKRDDMAGDRIRAADQIDDGTFEIVNQAALVICNGLRIGLLQFYAAGDAHHEGLRVFGEGFKHPDEVAHRLMHLAASGSARSAKARNALPSGRGN
jgi:hypothetical protein